MAALGFRAKLLLFPAILVVLQLTWKAAACGFRVEMLTFTE